MRGWLDILWRVRREVREDNVGLLAAACAFYLLLATVPMLAAVASLYGLVSSPRDIWEQFNHLRGLLPDQAFELLRGELLSLSVRPRGASLGLAAGIALSLWGGAKGTDGLMRALNVVYDEEETRSWIGRKLVALGLTLVGVFFGVFAAVLLVVLPTVLSILPSAPPASAGWLWLRWPILYGIALAWFALLYRFAPDRAQPRWQWVSPGALAGGLVWILASLLFAGAAARLGMGRTYGSLAAAILLLLWYHLSVWVVLIGGELNAEAEHQTARDSTTGPEEPMGSRGAFVADTLGDVPRSRSEDR